jgi:hypothetical protein
MMSVYLRQRAFLELQNGGARAGEVAKRRRGLSIAYRPQTENEQREPSFEAQMFHCFAISKGADEVAREVLRLDLSALARALVRRCSSGLITFTLPRALSNPNGIDSNAPEGACRTSTERVDELASP